MPDREQFRWKGRYAKEKSVVSKRKSVQAMTEAKKRRYETASNENICERKRLVDLVELGKNLICRKCNGTLSLLDILEEKRTGLLSIFKIRCSSCKTENSVPTHEMQKSDINRTVIQGEF